MDKHVDVHEVAAAAVDTEKKGKSGPTAGERRADGPTAGTKEQPQRERADLQLVKEHSQQARTDKEDWLRQEDREDPRSGRVAAKTRRGT